MSNVLSPINLYKEYIQKHRIAVKKDPVGLVVMPLQETREPLLAINTLENPEIEDHLKAFVDWANYVAGVIFYVRRVPHKLTYPTYLITDFNFTSEEEVIRFVDLLCHVEVSTSKHPLGI